MTFARRAGWLLGLLVVAGCGHDEVEPLPPLQRPSAERRAGLPEVGGRWLFAGFEIPAEDTARVNAEVYRLVPPGEIRVLRQRMDSVAGQYGVPGQYVLPFVGEVRHDGVFAAVVSAGDAGQQFVSARLMRDTLWMELSSLTQAATWPPRTRAAFVHRPRGAPFTRLLGGVPIVRGPDSATLAAMRLDSLRQDSLRQAAGVAPPITAQPRPTPSGAVQEPPTRPAPVPPAATEPRRPPARPPTRPRIDSTRIRPPLEPEGRDTPRPERRDTPRQPLPAPRETIRIGNPR